MNFKTFPLGIPTCTMYMCYGMVKEDDPTSATIVQGKCFLEHFLLYPSPLCNYVMAQTMKWLPANEQCDVEHTSLFSSCQS